MISLEFEAGLPKVRHKDGVITHHSTLVVASFSIWRKA